LRQCCARRTRHSITIASIGSGADIVAGIAISLTVVGAIVGIPLVLHGSSCFFPKFILFFNTTLTCS
jgi:hypothetical protein